MYNIFIYKSYFTHGYEKNHTSLKNCRITETIQATVYSLKSFSRRLKAFVQKNALALEHLYK